MILTIRTDNPEAEVGLYSQDQQLSYRKWPADRRLAKELLGAIRDELHAHHADWHDITGVIAYQGPGSFTGLRIGLTVANSIAYGLQVPVIAAQGDGWIAAGQQRLAAGEDDRLALPHYGAEANITLPKK